MRRKWIFFVPVLVLLSTCLIFRLVLFIGYVPTESMEPTLKKGSIIVGSRFFGDLKVGDIIVFRHEEKMLVKRITAMQGDFVYHKGELVKVSAENLYVLGDNQWDSFDSRYWENPYIDKSDVLAIIFH